MAEDRVHSFASYNVIGKVLPYQDTCDNEEPVVRPHDGGLLVRVKGCLEKPPVGSHVLCRVFSRRKSAKSSKGGIAYGCLERVLLTPDRKDYRVVEAILQNVRKARNFHYHQYSSRIYATEGERNIERNQFKRLFEQLISGDYRQALEVLLHLKISVENVMHCIPYSDEKSRDVAHRMQTRLHYLGESLQNLLK